MNKSRNGGCIFKLVKLAVLSIIILSIVIYFSLGFIADYTLKTITAGTGIDAGVSSVSIGISDQKVEVYNFYLTNPPDYPKGNAIAFDEAVIDADVSISDLLFKKLIALDEIRVIGLSMNLDLKTGSGLSALTTAPVSNLGEISKIFQSKESDAQSESYEADPTATTQSSDEVKIIIKKLVFEAGKVNGSINGASTTISLPSFTLENLGVEQGGLTPTELSVEITAQLTSLATKTLINSTISTGSDVKDAAVDAVDNLSNKILNLF